MFDRGYKLELIEENTSSGATRHLPLKGKAFGTFFLAFPFRGRWHDEVVTDEVLLLSTPTGGRTMADPSGTKARQLLGCGAQPHKFLFISPPCKTIRSCGSI